MADELHSHLLGRCGQCDFALFATDEDLREADTPADVRTGAAYKLGFSPRYYARCPQNHKIFRLHRIEGTYSEEFNCDSRCLNAKGNVCKCSCGGLNHGKGHAIAEVHTLHDPTAVVVPVEHRSATVEQEQVERYRPTQYHLGEVGDKIEYTGTVILHRPTVTDSVLFVLQVANPDGKMGEAIVKWFCPTYALPEPAFELGDVIEFMARVKRHVEDGYGKHTLVTYLEAN